MGHGNLVCHLITYRKFLQFDQKFMKPSKGQIKNKILNFKRKEREHIGLGSIWCYTNMIIVYASFHSLKHWQIHATWKGILTKLLTLLSKVIITNKLNIPYEKIWAGAKLHFSAQVLEVFLTTNLASLARQWMKI